MMMKRKMTVFFIALFLIILQIHAFNNNKNHYSMPAYSSSTSNKNYNKMKYYRSNMIGLGLGLGLGLMSANVNEQSPTKNVLIIGGGPAGLLLSHALLSRKDKNYKIHLIEAREDPRQEESGARAYSLGLNLRGQTAIKTFDKEERSHGLWQALCKEGIFSDSFFLHINKLKVQIRKPAKSSQINNLPPPTLLIPRNRLCSTLLDELEKHHGNSSRLDVKFHSRLRGVDFSKKVATIVGEREGTSIDTSFPYDLIVGSDGVGSVVRSSMLEQQDYEFEQSQDKDKDTQRKSGAFISEEIILPGAYKVMVVEPSPPQLESASIHLMTCTAKNSSNVSLFLIPAPGNKTCTLLSWSGEEVPAIMNEKDKEKVKLAIEKDFPLFGQPPDKSIDQLSKQKPSVAKTIRCNLYHHNKGAALLLGDSAHSTGGTLGQGANSALLDVVAFDAVLDETNDDLAKALPLFSRRQVKEGLALWKLLQLPASLSPLAKLMYSVVQFIRDISHKIAPKIFKTMSTRNALSLSLTPFSKIVEQNSFFVNQAIKKFKRIEYEE